MAHARNMIAERWPSRYFGDYRPDENNNQVSQADVAALLDSVDNVDRPLIVENVAEDFNAERIVAEFYCSWQMAGALIDHVRAGGR